MPLTSDRKRRVEQYLAALKRRLITRVASIEIEMATTHEHLSPEAAARLSYSPCPPGTPWGGEWEYGWFRGTAVLPSGVEGRRVELLYEGGESVVWVNGRLAGGINHFHKTVLLSETAAPGERFDILIETYAGHGKVIASYGPVNPGERVLPPVPAQQRVFSEASIVIWDEEGYQLYMDMLTLYDATGSMDPNSMRRHKIEKVLVDVTFIIDLEDNPSSFGDSVRRARAFLAPALAAVNGSTTPEMYCIGHAHIDVAWLWPIAQTMRKAAATFSTATELMKQYPDYRFLQSQPVLYAYVKEHYPDLYEEIKRAVKAGRWVVDGGLWVECDTNLPSGESLVRQFLYGKRFVREEFGLDSKVAWLPDVFGYSGAFPQIMKGCGVEYFSTHKIFWNYHGGTTFPYDTFIWEGIDGTAVLAHLHRDYNAQTGPSHIVDRWNKALRKAETDLFLYPFGWGDGGGGPTRDHLEFLRRLGDFEGVPKTRQTSPEEFFREVERRGLPADRYVGELYFEAHRGVYTSQAGTKWGNRKSEFALRDAELWSTAAHIFNGVQYPDETLEQAWKQVLLNQFHDIIPGSSIARVYEEANAGYERVIEDISRLSAVSRATFLSAREQAFTVWNSLPWTRSVYAELPIGAGVVTDASGNVLAAQEIATPRGKALLVRVPDVPSCGARSVYALSAAAASPTCASSPSALSACATPAASPAASSPTCASTPCASRSECAPPAAGSEQGLQTLTTPPRGGASARQDGNTGQYMLENEFLRLTVNRCGEITSLFDKDACRELVMDGHVLNRMELYQDQPADFEAWDIDISYKDKPIELSRCGEAQLVECGPLEVRLRIERKIHNSSLAQDIVLRSGERRVDFQTEVDWDEVHKLLKVAFPVDVHSTEARYEIQFGHVKRSRSNNTDFEKARFEVSGHKWMDVSEPEYGFAILNDCKYGWDVLDGIPRLTLLRAPVAPDPQADRCHHAFTYAVYPHNEAFGAAVVRQGYELNAPVSVDRGELCQSNCRSLIAVSEPNVIVETVKRSEDGRSVIVRAYEATGQRTACAIDFGFEIADASVCNLLEEELQEEGSQPVCISGRRVELAWRPFEIKTLRVTVGSNTV